MGGFEMAGGQRLTQQDLSDAIPASPEEFRDLAAKLRDFEASLSDGQRAVMHEAVRPVRSPYASGPPQFDEATAHQLFGDAASREDLQNFLAANANVDPNQVNGAMISLIVSAAFRC